MAPGTPLPHDGVIYRSRGSVLVTGDSPIAADAARELVRRAPNLRIALFAPGAGAHGDLPATVKAVGGRIVSLRGHLGWFSASVRVAVDKTEDAGIFSGNEDRHFDLVLDLCREPLLRQRVPPYGYYAPGGDAAALVQALDSLAQLTGDFHKPEYVDYRPQLCAHGAMGVAGCMRCLDVCATKAIRSNGEKIEVDPFVCQGCASCTLACPTGALGFQHPAPGALQDLLDERLAKCGAAAHGWILVLHDAVARHLLPPMDIARVLLFEVNPLPAFSELLWLKALTNGVGGLVLVMAPATPPQARQLIEDKLEELRTMLSGLGCDPEVLQTANPQNLAAAIARIRSTTGPSAMTATKEIMLEPKRESLLVLIDAVAASRKTGGQADESRTLAPGAAFGTVLVDVGKCTICLACTHLCPTGALNGQLDPAPELVFRESLCIQCDLCRAGCPEQAIKLQPRFVPSPVARDAVRELASDQLVACSNCGIPFIGRRKLAVGMALMQEYAPEMPGGIDSLRKCPSCRQRETMLKMSFQ